MKEHEASRTLVKSPPELWAELSDQESLSAHLAGPFGEIRITRVDPETAVAWEGERARGTVRIEPAGWGTRVTLTATAVRAETPSPEPARPPAPAPDPPPRVAAAPARPDELDLRRGFRARLLGWLRTGPEEGATGTTAPVPPIPPAAPAPPAPPGPPAPERTPEPDPKAALARVLDDLGAAHHRPFSRN